MLAKIRVKLLVVKKQISRKILNVSTNIVQHFNIFQHFSTFTCTVLSNLHLSYKGLIVVFKYLKIHLKFNNNV